MLAQITLITILTSLASASPLIKRAPAFKLHPAGDQNLCLGVPTGTTPGDGTALYNVPCNSANTGFEIAKGDNQVVRLTGTNFCLDAGSNPMDNGPAKLWTCYPGLGNQRWYYTDDNHIAITGGTVCLDGAGGGCGLGGCAPGTKTCGSARGQTWTAEAVGSVPPSVTPSITPSATGPSSSAKPTTTPVPPTGGKLIHPNKDNSKCLNLNSMAVADGTEVSFGGCNGQSARWDINRGDGKVKLFGTNYCLDAGSQPANGIRLKVWTCYAGLPQQQWYYTNDDHIAITGGTQCADLRKEDGKTLQTWTCSGNNPQQVFTTGP